MRRKCTTARHGARELKDLETWQPCFLKPTMHVHRQSNSSIQNPPPPPNLEATCWAAHAAKKTIGEPEASSRESVKPDPYTLSGSTPWYLNEDSFKGYCKYWDHSEDLNKGLGVSSPPDAPQPVGIIQLSLAHRLACGMLQRESWEFPFESLRKKKKKPRPILWASTILGPKPYKPYKP